MNLRPKTQAEIDEIMSVYGKQRYDRAYHASIEYGRETSHPAGRFVLREAVGRMNVAFLEWDVACSKDPKGPLPKALKLLRQVGYSPASLIAAQVVLDSFSIGRSYQKLARSIGHEIEAEVRFIYVRQYYPMLWEDLTRNYDTRNWTKKLRALKQIANAAQKEGRFEWAEDGWGHRDRLRVGSVMLEMLALHTGIVTIKPVFRKTAAGIRRELLVIPSPAAEEWIREAHDFGRERAAYFLPMVERPIKWSSMYDGGYHANIIRRSPVCRTSRDVKDDITQAKMPEVFRALNSIQDVPWRVDANVFEVLDYFWSDAGTAVADLPPRDPYPVPEPPDPWVDDSQEVKDWKSIASSIHQENRDLGAARALTSKIHHTATTFRDQPFWFPHKLDFRGRIYPIPTCGMTPQGCDLGKALLQFDQALPVSDPEARDWHSIHGANVWGNDKAPLEERIAWADDNRGMIQAVSEDPLDVLEWTKADEPWQFLAWCFDRDALLQAEDKGTVHMSRLPVSQDATSSGLQLYALLLRDPAAARATNVLYDGERRDIYQDVADRVTVLLREVAEGKRPADCTKNKDEWEDGQAYARDWLAFTGGRVPRECTKRPVMVLPYGGTPHSTREYVGDWMMDELRKRGGKEVLPFQDVWYHSHMLGSLIWEAMREVIRGATAGMDWIRSAARVASKKGMDLGWTAPSGFRVRHSYRRLRSRDVTTTLGRRVIIRRRYATTTDTINGSRQTNGSAPNFIHSLDASLLTLATNRLVAAGVTDIGVVHDCYASHAANAATVGRVLRETTADMFTTDILGDLKAEIEDAVGEPLPELPAYGDLDPACVIDSPYYFS